MAGASPAPTPTMSRVGDAQSTGTAGAAAIWWKTDVSSTQWLGGPDAADHHHEQDDQARYP